MLDRYKNYLKRIEERLNDFFSADKTDITIEAMKYSLFAGGKRIRPLLCAEFAYLCNGNAEDSFDYACAIEMIHTYSLIHDDLPCMDDDDMRRGKASCHVKFGEEYALLAGDALLTMAFEVISKCRNDSEKNILAIERLSKCAGVSGMIGGQTKDLLNEGKECNIDEISNTDYLKTSKLIEASCILGCISSCATEKQISFAEKYAKNMGIAFQIRDDILDVTSTNEILGKPIGSDVEKKKSTYVSILGIDEARRMAEKYTFDAIHALDIFSDRANDLRKFTLDLLGREK